VSAGIDRQDNKRLALWRSSGTAFGNGLRVVGILLALLVVVQSFIVVEARPQDLVTGFHGMVDIIRRAVPPDFSKLPKTVWPALETVDIAIFGTLVGLVMAVPLAVMGAANVTPSRIVYYCARGLIAFTRAVPDLVWALFFVTAVGLGPFPGGLALAVHSLGMLGRLFAETIEHMDMAPIDALSLTGARPIQVFTHGIIPSVLPALLGIGRAAVGNVKTEACLADSHPLAAAAHVYAPERPLGSAIFRFTVT